MEYCQLVGWILLSQGEQRAPALVSMVLPMIAIGFLFYFMLIRPERQKQANHQSLLSDLKKNDRVVTIGGIKGIVSNVNREIDEVVVNVDESTGTKIRVSLQSISRVEDRSSRESATKK